MRQLGNATNRQRAKNYKQEDSKTSLTSQFQTAHRLAARAKTRAIFVKKLWQQRVCRYHLAKPPPSPRDENFVFVTNFPQPEQTPPDPLRNPVASAYLVFSYRVIPKRQIRAGGHLIIGAKNRWNFRQETGNARDKISRA